MDAACNCSVLLHFEEECDLEVMKQELQAATECVQACAAIKLFKALGDNAEPLWDKIQKEFSSDVMAIVQKSHLHLKLEDLEADDE
jgi:predicted DsbA family dithiol-disulfide isomerase